MRHLGLLLVLAFVIGCGGPNPAPTKTASAEDPRLTALKDAIAKTTDEGKGIIEKVKAMKPEVNDQPSSKSLADLVDDFSKNKGEFNISPIGWEAAQKKNGRWKVLFHYQDYQKHYSTAEWELNPQTSKLYPFDFKNAPQFWTGVGAEKTQAGGKASK
jgi:hypothetical protein